MSKIWVELCIVSYRIVSYRIVFHWIAPYSIVLHCIVHVVLYCIALHHTVLYCVVLYCVLCCVVLYCTALHCFVLYCIHMFRVEGMFWIVLCIMYFMLLVHSGTFGLVFTEMISEVYPIVTLLSIWHLKHFVQNISAYYNHPFSVAVFFNSRNYMDVIFSTQCHCHWSVKIDTYVAQSQNNLWNECRIILQNLCYLRNFYQMREKKSCSFQVEAFNI